MEYKYIITYLDSMGILRVDVAESDEELESLLSNLDSYGIKAKVEPYSRELYMKYVYKRQGCVKI